jgi:hypothetical protein
MNKKELYFSLYVKNELENDIEIVGTFNNMEELENFFEKSKRYLYSLGVKKQKKLRINIEIDNTSYYLVVDQD